MTVTIARKTESLDIRIVCPTFTRDHKRPSASLISKFRRACVVISATNIKRDVETSLYISFVSPPLPETIK